jgi:hypothetical protein
MESDGRDHVWGACPEIAWFIRIVTDIFGGTTSGFVSLSIVAVLSCQAVKEARPAVFKSVRLELNAINVAMVRRTQIVVRERRICAIFIPGRIVTPHRMVK